jgi:hypothetical protein
VGNSAQQQLMNIGQESGSRAAHSTLAAVGSSCASCWQAILEGAKDEHIHRLQMAPREQEVRALRLLQVLADKSRVTVFDLNESMPNLWGNRFPSRPLRRAPSLTTDFGCLETRGFFLDARYVRGCDGSSSVFLVGLECVLF